MEYYTYVIFFVLLQYTKNNKALSTVQLSRLTSPAAVLCKRHLSLHEHLSMDIMRKYGVRVPRGEIAITPEQARTAAEKFGM